MAYKEKRREERYYVDLVGMVVPADEIMKIIDVSLHGISVVGASELEVDHSVDITISIDDISVSVNAVVRNSIIWDGDYRYGMEISSPSDSWMDIVYSQMKRNR